MATILIVDDEPVNRLLLAAILQPLGHAVVEAGNGSDGLRAAREYRPDLTIVDLMMPDMDGATFVRKLRADAATASLLLVLSTASRPDAAMRGFMADYAIGGIIEKPSEPQAVADVVAAALRR